MNESAFHPLHEAFPAVVSWLEGQPRDPVSTAADTLCALFDLGEFERNVLLLAAYAALEEEAGDRLAALHGDKGRSGLTVGALLAAAPGANWGAFAADSGLRRFRLIETSQDASLTGQTVAIAESVLFYLLGRPSLSAALADHVHILRAPPRLSPSRSALRDRIRDRITLSEPEVLMLTGTDAVGKVQAMKAVCDALGEVMVLLDCSLIPPSTPEQLAFARMLERDIRLLGARLVLRLGGPGEEASLRTLVQALGVPVCVVCDEPIVISDRAAARIETPRASARDQAQVWREFLGSGAQWDEAIALISGSFHATPELAASVKAAVASEGDTPGAEALSQRVWATCRENLRPRMNELAERVESRVEWDDLVLPRKQKDVLAEMVGHARNRARVYEDWGFGEKLQDRGLGISALLCGPSGAGKTMAGEVVANALGLDLYRIDLSAVVSKWLGETEKNIRRLFEAAEGGGVVMQFDEADALFGKRSEVKDSHDRHANIEVSYLLQKLEAYRGLVILTTNLKDNIDQAFLRRIRFVLDFRFPNQRERLEIWRRMFPANVPLETLDYEALSRLNVAGGTIRNIALGAAFRAARDGSAVTMRHVQASAQVEYDKSGKIMTDHELAGWRV